MKRRPSVRAIGMETRVLSERLTATLPRLVADAVAITEAVLLELFFLIVGEGTKAGGRALEANSDGCGVDMSGCWFSEDIRGLF